MLKITKSDIIAEAKKALFRYVAYGEKALAEKDQNHLGLYDSLTRTADYWKGQADALLALAECGWGRYADRYYIEESSDKTHILLPLNWASGAVVVSDAEGAWVEGGSCGYGTISGLSIYNEVRERYPDFSMSHTGYSWVIVNQNERICFAFCDGTRDFKDAAEKFEMFVVGYRCGKSGLSPDDMD